MACRAMWGANRLKKVPAQYYTHLLGFEATIEGILNSMDMIEPEGRMLATVYNVIDILCSRRGRSNGAAQFSEHVMSGLTDSSARRESVINILSWMASQVCCLCLCHEQQHLAQHAFCQQIL